MKLQSTPSLICSSTGFAFKYLQVYPPARDKTKSFFSFFFYARPNFMTMLSNLTYNKDFRTAGSPPLNFMKKSRTLTLLAISLEEKKKKKEKAPLPSSVNHGGLEILEAESAE